MSRARATSRAITVRDPCPKSTVLLSPHAAYLSDRSERDGTRLQAENVVTWARTGRPPRVVVEGRA